MLAVAPGTTPAGGMLMLTAASADHVLIVPDRIPGQAPARRTHSQAAFAFARLIRLRRSAERSSSFKPPQVPYFSGLLTA